MSKKELKNWWWDWRVLSFIDKNENIITQEEWELYKGRYKEPSDEVLNAILEIRSQDKNRKI